MSRIAASLILIRGNHDHDGDHVPYYKRNGSDGNGNRNAASQRRRPPIGGDAISTVNVLPGLLDIPMHEDYQMDVGGKPYLVLHGDRFDPTLNSPVVTEVACFCYQLTTKVNKKLAKWLKKKSKRWSGVLGFVRGQAGGSMPRRKGSSRSHHGPHSFRRGFHG